MQFSDVFRGKKRAIFKPMGKNGNFQMFLGEKRAIFKPSKDKKRFSDVFREEKGNFQMFLGE